MTEIDIKDLKGWTKRLSKRQIEHLKDDAFVRTTQDLKETLEFTIDHHDSGLEYCWICYEIALNLGVVHRKVEVIWKQEDYDGRCVKLSRTFDSREDAEEWIDDMEKNAKKIGKPFTVIDIKEVKE